MKLLHGKLGSLPPALLLLTSQVAAQALLPTAIRKMSPDDNEKFFPEYVAFAPDANNPSYHAALAPREADPVLRLSRDAEELQPEPLPVEEESIPRYRPPFKFHGEEGSRFDVFRRAAEALKLLSKREACPPSMNSCEDAGFPNKCCFEGETCVRVEDSTVGNVACCPDGVTCNGGVGKCPSTAVTCPADLGGGCCIPGYICKGLGCVPSPVAESTPSTTQRTLTITSTTMINGAASTVVVTIVTTIISKPDLITSTSTSTSTRVVSEEPSTTTSGDEGTSNAGAPYRPTSTDSDSPSADFNIPDGAFCPVGYYACLARAGGGCCRTGRNCATTSCPPTPMTTIISGSITVAVPVTDVPEDGEIKTCATGWYLCGEEAGPVAGCCPDGYTCGTASCTVVTPEETAEIQKSFPSGGWAFGAGVKGVISVMAALITAVLVIS